ncbi:hypothetical protein Cgig2_009223 [Carnegiea gigantea]|uniref:Myb/SANT-like domain-containing protein n=1 Tax=Carnegiea gigantea TaxID=171969 RepID=A0A9Q1QFZ4_9CARY|nr:hypothetical protein Cgig2_009223 [Carnegiea gigantea]
MVSPKHRGVGKSKRKWEEDEDDALIEVLNDLVNGGSFKADYGFKPGSATCAFWLQHFKGIYNIIHDMVVGSCTNGFGWDSETKLVVAKKEGWKAYVKNLPKGNDWRERIVLLGKMLKALKKWKMKEENEESSKKDEHESSSTQELSGVEASSWKYGNLRKFVRASNNLVKGLLEVASILYLRFELMPKEIRVASSNISRAVDFDIELSEKRSKLNEELANLGLTTIERHRATRKIASEPECEDIFFSIPDAEKKELVQALL